MAAGETPPSDTPPAATRRHAQGLLGWYYSPTGTLIRIALYAIVIGLVVAWRMGYIWQPPPAPTQTLDTLEVVGWKKMRWQTTVPDTLPMGELPFIEVTFTEPPGKNRAFSLQQLADGLHLFTPAEPHTLLSWPIGASGPVGDTGNTTAAVDEAVQPRAFNGQWVVSFLIRPDQLATLPDTLWLVYLNPTTATPPGATPQIQPMAVLTPALLKATVPPKNAAAPATPAAPATKPE